MTDARTPTAAPVPQPCGCPHYFTADDCPHRVDPRIVVKGVGGGYFCRSQSTPGGYWFIDTDEHGRLACSCPATTERCRHMRLAAEFWAAEDATHARLTFPPNVSALVD